MADPAGGIKIPSPNPSGEPPVTDATPTLRGSSAGEIVSYDIAVKRWLPVPASSVRSDGLAYAYSELYQGSWANHSSIRMNLHIVSLPSGNDRIVASGGAFDVMAYGADGIYIVGTLSTSAGPATSGLLRVDPVTGTAAQLSDRLDFVSISNGFGWQASYPTLTRVDLGTGDRQLWVQVRGYSFFIGNDSYGHPFVIVSVDGGAQDVLMLFTTPLRGIPLAQSFQSMSITVTDSHGTWFGREDGSVDLYDPVRGMLRVSEEGGTGLYPLLSFGYPAGPCA